MVESRDKGIPLMKPNRQYILTEGQLSILLKAYLKLRTLENNGVSQWERYFYAINQIKDYNELVELYIQDYPEY